MQYTGHAAPVLGVCIPSATAARVASCDQNGGIHVWSLQNGRCAHLFREPQQRRRIPEPSVAAVSVYNLDSDSEADSEPQSTPRMSKPLCPVPQQSSQRKRVLGRQNSLSEAHVWAKPHTLLTCEGGK